jgi:hypothetical protein
VIIDGSIHPGPAQLPPAKIKPLQKRGRTSSEEAAAAGLNFYRTSPADSERERGRERRDFFGGSEIDRVEYLTRTGLPFV